MKRKLFRQILNEWPANTWLAIELLLVSVIMWYIADKLWVTYSTLSEPRGFDTEHCYKVNISYLDSKSPEYVPTPEGHDENRDIMAILDRLEARPEVEAVGAGVNAHPYNGSNSGISFSLDSLSTGDRFIVLRRITPGFIKVFRYRGANGETPEELAALLADCPPARGYLLADNIFERDGIESVHDLAGKTIVKTDGDSARFEGSYLPVRYDDFISNLSGSSSAIENLGEKRMHWANEFVIRVRENMDKDIIGNIMADGATSLRVGNYYISGVESFEDIRRNSLLTREEALNGFIATAFFLILNIFLGVLGTFWFRTSQRTPEISLRMVCGAKRLDIFRRVVSEGEIILLMVTPFAIAIDYVLAHFELNAWYGDYFTPVRFFGCALIVWLLLALMIAGGSAIPAWRAMHISPADALKQE